MQILILLLVLIPLNIQSYASEAKEWLILKEGDCIDVIAPGYGARDGSVEKARANIERLGLNARIPDDLINPHPLGYSNTEEYRANHLKQLLRSENTKAIWALRGGRGSSLLLPYLKDINSDGPAKLLIGFSDITALHLLAAQLGWPSLHSIVLGYNQDANTAVNGKSPMTEVIDILTGKVREVQYTLTPSNKTAKSGDINISASVTGGNLSVIQRSIGTETSLNTTGRMLFLEDTGEAPTRTNETFNHLDRAGTLNGIKALVLGNFKDDDVEKYDFLKREIGAKMDQRGIPVFISDDFGHRPVNHPLPFNTPALLKSNGPKEIIVNIQTNNGSSG